MIELTCPGCARRLPLSDDEAVLFYPRYLCPACGAAVPVPLKPEDYVRELRNVDRDRRISPPPNQST